MAASLVVMCRQGRESAASLLCTKYTQMFTSAARWLSSRSVPLITRNIEGFELCSYGGQSNGQHPRPVVVLIGWLNARRKHLRKYQELYCGRGLDVLTMPVSPIHIVRPRTGITYTKKLLKVLQKNEELSSRQVVVHGFSIGAFIYTQLQLMLQQQQQRQQQLQRDLGQVVQEQMNVSDLTPRLAGLVLDSPAYMDHMCHGIAHSLTNNPAARVLIKKSLLLYLAAFPKSVTFHYQESHRMFHDNSIPTLILYSATDLISSAVTSESYVAEWRQKGFPAYTCRFDDSTHVGHFRQHPEAYREALDSFLDKLDLAGPGLVQLAATAQVQ